MNDSDREQLLDARIQRRLASDAAYRNAENAEDQSAREWAIEREEEARLEREQERARAARELAEKAARELAAAPIVRELIAACGDGSTFAERDNARQLLDAAFNVWARSG